MSVSRPRVAYIGLSLELYLSTSGKYLDTWRQAFDLWSEKLSSFAEISCRKLCFTSAEVEEIGEEIKSADVDAVVLSSVSYTPSMLIVPLLKKLGLPIVIWSTQDSPVINDPYVPEDLTKNHTVQGIQDITNVLFQSQIPFEIITGHWTQPHIMERLKNTLNAVRAARAAKNIRVLALGGAFIGMGDFDYDPENLRSQWGPEVVDIGAAEFLEAVAAVDEKCVEEVYREDLEKFEIVPGLQPETHKESIRRKLATKALLEKYQANAFTMNFTAFDGTFGQLPFYAINTLMAEGIGYAGEGDVLRAAAMRQLIELAGEANFSEIYTVDFQRDLFFMSHMQECSIGIAHKDRKVRLKQMPFWVKGMPDYTGMFFTAEPGDYTLVCITPAPGGTFRMIAMEGNVPDLPVQETYNRAYWFFRPMREAGEMLDRYSIAGGAHHLSALKGRKSAELALLARQLGFTFVDLDKDTL